MVEQSVKLEGMQTTELLMRTIVKMTSNIKRMNVKMKIPEVGRVIMEFEKQSAIFESKQEFLQDSLDTGDSDLEESEIISKIYDEIGLDLDLESRLQKTKLPTTKPTLPVTSELINRLAKLKK